MAAELLAAHPSLPDELGEDHYAGLYIAAARGDAEALETLLSAGFDPDHPDESIGKTALHVAAMEGWPGAAEVLLDRSRDASGRQARQIESVGELGGLVVDLALAAARVVARGKRDVLVERDVAQPGRTVEDTPDAPACGVHLTLGHRFPIDAVERDTTAARLDEPAREAIAVALLPRPSIRHQERATLVVLSKSRRDRLPDIGIGGSGRD